MTRPVRVLLVAHDGFSAGHVARTIAIARGLARTAAARGFAVRALLATTSEARALWADEPLAVVTLPAPAAARRAGLSDAERRKLARAALAGIVDGFGPDLVVVDTFPSGPHGELAGLCEPAGRGAGAPRSMKRALIRRATSDRRPGPRGALAADLRDVLTAGLAGYDLAVLAGDPGPQATAGLALPDGLAVVEVPPITLAEGRDGLDRAAARARLGLGEGRAILVAAGGGGDDEAAARAQAIAEAIVRVAPEVTVVIARGPLASGAAVLAAPPGSSGARIRVVELAPLQPVLAAFDGAFSAAGYNTAHELAKARVPAALFAQPRSFDDQAGRAARFAAAGLAHALVDLTDEAIAAALGWMQTAQLPVLPADGADRAADALLDLVTGGAGAARTAHGAQRR